MIGFITQRQSLLPTQKRQDPVSYIGEKHPDLSRQSPINLYTVSIHFFISLQLTNNTAGGMPIPCPRGGWFVWRSPRGLPCASFGESMLVPRSFMAVVYHKFTRRGGVRSEGGRNKLRPSRMGSRHLGGEDGERGAGAQTIAIPALPQRARCALSQYAAAQERGPPAWGAAKMAALHTGISGVRKQGAGRTRQDPTARTDLSLCRGCAWCVGRPPA